jgi:ABC-type sugar transport system permease subunit
MRLLFAIFITLLSLFYLLPFAIAFNRKRANTGAIFTLNLFLGWSLIGWVVALVWALKAEQVL